MIRVLVAEDSATAREVILTILARDPEIEVVGVAKDGAEAVALTRRLRPDIVTMDIHMPVLDGYEATRRIMVEMPTAILIVSASVNVKDAQTSLDALGAGALGLSERPSLTDSTEDRDRFLRTLRALSDVKVVRRARPAPVAPARPTAPATGSAQIVAIAASTGGPAALAQIVAALPAGLPAPILVVQHNTHGFTPALATWLTGAGKLPVRIPEHGERLVAGAFYLAPDDHHLGADGGGRAILDPAAPIGGFRPSATYLFTSVARGYGSRALAVVLTGMGSDGTEGLRYLRAAGGHVVAQDESSSVVFGMPRAAIAAGVVDEVASLEDLPKLMCAAVGWDR